MVFGDLREPFLVLNQSYQIDDSCLGCMASDIIAVMAALVVEESAFHT